MQTLLDTAHCRLTLYRYPRQSQDPLQAWDAADEPQRRRTGLHFDRVLAVKTLNLQQHDKDEVLSLLSVSFAETDAPSGEVLLTFSGGCTVRLIVECLECQMADLGPAWAAQGVPSHPLDEDGAP